MKRSERMGPVQRVLGKTERERALDLGAAQRQLDEAEKKLAELRQYQIDYLQSFQQRARRGQTVHALRDFQTFLARLEDAIKVQEQLVAAEREGLKGSTVRWQSAAQKVKAVDSVVDRWQADERRAADRTEQKETDDRAQGKAARARSNAEAR
jgi:flagellar protein FliJ